MKLSDFTAQPARLEILEAGKELSRGRAAVAEGKFHQVRRMFAATGHEVLELTRTRFGPLTLEPGLPEGAWRELTEEELLPFMKLVRNYLMMCRLSDGASTDDPRYRIAWGRTKPLHRGRGRIAIRQ